MLFRVTPPGAPNEPQPGESQRADRSVPGHDRLDPLDLVVDGLKPFDRSVVEMAYGSGHTMRRIADALASTPEQVSSVMMAVYREVSAAIEASGSSYAPAAR